MRAGHPYVHERVRVQSDRERVSKAIEAAYLAFHSLAGASTDGTRAPGTNVSWTPGGHLA